LGLGGRAGTARLLLGEGANGMETTDRSELVPMLKASIRGGTEETRRPADGDEEEADEQEGGTLGVRLTVVDVVPRVNPPFETYNPLMLEDD